MNIGDCFTDGKFIFLVLTFETLNLVKCKMIHLSNELDINSIEHRNTLLKMRKLTSLEKELM